MLTQRVGKIVTTSLTPYLAATRGWRSLVGGRICPRHPLDTALLKLLLLLRRPPPLLPPAPILAGAGDQSLTCSSRGRQIYCYCGATGVFAAVFCLFAANKPHQWKGALRPRMNRAVRGCHIATHRHQNLITSSPTFCHRRVPVVPAENKRFSLHAGRVSATGGCVARGRRRKAKGQSCCRRREYFLHMLVRCAVRGCAARPEAGYPAAGPQGRRLPVVPLQSGEQSS